MHRPAIRSPRTTIKALPMLIRPAGADDIPAIKCIIRDAYQKYVERIGKPPGPMLDNYEEHVRTHSIWVAEQQRALCGLIVLLAEADHLLLDNVAIDPSWQRKGIGRELMSFAEREAKRRGYRELRLYTHEKMIENLAMYRSLGWQETGRGTQDGYARVFFCKAI